MNIKNDTYLSSNKYSTNQNSALGRTIKKNKKAYQINTPETNSITTMNRANSSNSLSLLPNISETYHSSLNTQRSRNIKNPVLPKINQNSRSELSMFTPPTLNKKILLPSNSALLSPLALQSKIQHDFQGKDNKYSSEENSNFYVTGLPKELKEKNLIEKKILTPSEQNTDSIEPVESPRNDFLSNPIWEMAKKVNNDVKLKEYSKKKIGEQEFIPIKEMIQRSKNVSLAKYNLQCHKEKLFFIQKNTRNEILAINKSIESINKVKEKITSNCFDKMTSILKELDKKLILENDKRFELRAQKQALQNDITKLNDSINKHKDDLSSLSKWFYFLIKIKENVLELPSSYITVNTYIDTITYNNNKEQKKKNSKLINDYELVPKEIKDKINDYRKNLMFESADSFITYFNGIKDTVQELLIEQTLKIDNLNKLKKNYEIKSKEQNLLENSYSSNIIKLEQELAELKERYNSNKKQKIKLLSDPHFREPKRKLSKSLVGKVKVTNVRAFFDYLISQAIKFFNNCKYDAKQIAYHTNNEMDMDNIFFNKILAIFSVCYIKDMFPKNIYSNPEDLLTKIEVNEENQMTFMIIHIDNVANFLINKFEEYNKDPKCRQLLEDIEEDMVKENRRNKNSSNTNQKQIIEKELEKKRKELEEKINRKKPPIMRKVNQHYEQLLKKHKVVQEKKNSFVDLNLEDFLFDVDGDGENTKE